MPDIFEIINRRWKIIVLLTLTATLLALVISLLQPKEYLGTVTALPANSALTDKAKVFNNNIETLYPELGTVDELDRIEGTAKLDTLYIFVAEKQNLATYYNMANSSEAMYKAAMKLKRATDIRRSAYGELKINVWDKNPLQAAQLANSIVEGLNNIHQRVSGINNAKVLAQLQTSYDRKKTELDSLQRLMIMNEGSRTGIKSDSSALNRSANRNNNGSSSITRLSMLQEQTREFEKIISQYELASNTTIQPLIVVEQARPALHANKPKVLQTVLFAFGASLIFSILLAVYADSRNQKL
ncbi:MAG: hypothetical protein EOO10_11960 [Chitinophagaceae bacterium]|nr:MAG: hypothetical protein EOO10_11960 [Chitinophagaceae bacterium]